MRNVLKQAVAALILPGLLLTATAKAGDRQREARIAAQITDAILEGETVWLQAGDVRFLGIYTEATDPSPRGAVILLHGRDANPDWPEVIYPLRTRLTTHGWSTLSIQLPVSAPDAAPGAWRNDIPLAAPRITAAANWLADKGYGDLVLAGHSLGARMGAEYLAGMHGDAATNIRAFVAIGLTANPADTERGSLLALSRIRVPILDLYGERDFGGVTGSAAARERAALKAKDDNYTPHYTQVEVPGADHFFRGVDELLASRVRAWLARYIATTP